MGADDVVVAMVTMWLSGSVEEIIDIVGVSGDSVVVVVSAVVVAMVTVVVAKVTAVVAKVAVVVEV